MFPTLERPPAPVRQAGDGKSVSSLTQSAKAGPLFEPMTKASYALVTLSATVFDNQYWGLVCVLVSNTNDAEGPSWHNTLPTLSVIGPNTTRIAALLQ
jgi:hypothetical protein